MDDKLTTLIVEELTHHRDRKELVRMVCERGRLHWKDAERLVEEVEAQHRRTIAARQTPLLLFFSIGTLVVGLGLMAMNLQPLLTFFQKDVVGQVLSVQSGYYQILGLVSGLGMSAGGLVGLWKAMGAIFPD
jgi:hypothetical protein